MEEDTKGKAGHEVEAQHGDRKDGHSDVVVADKAHSEQGGEEEEPSRGDVATNGDRMGVDVKRRKRRRRTMDVDERKKLEDEVQEDARGSLRRVFREVGEEGHRSVDAWAVVALVLDDGVLGRGGSLVVVAVGPLLALGYKGRGRKPFVRKERKKEGECVFLR